MALLELLAAGVGVGVAKGILKLWFQEDPVAAGVGNSLIDIIRSKTADKLEQRRSKKQFDQIAKRVAKSVKEAIDASYPMISAKRKDFIAKAAGTTVNTTEFSANLLVKANLSPDNLLNLFLEKSGGEGGHPGLSGKGTKVAPPDEQHLYRTILSEAAQLIVDGASQYPKYSDAVFSELLKGQDEHVEKFDLILEELRRIRSGRQGEDSAYDDFDEAYRRAVVRRLDELQLFGVDLAASSKRYKLSTAYVSLLVEREALQIGGEPETSAAESDDDEEEDNRESVRVEEALAQTSRLFIRGGPGSGKTTLLQWIAVMSSARNLDGDLSAWNDYVPFFIRLREFANQKLPSPDVFASLISEALLPAPDGWVRAQLNSGRAVVLVDGLDELPAEQKDDVRIWLKDLAGQYDRARIVLSSRPAAAQEGWLEPEGFLDAELQDMTSADITSFIAHWHDAAREGVKEPDRIKELCELEEALGERIQKSASIHKLATSPLLCAVICALHRDRMRNIPEDRIELYQACIEMFFRRDHERRIELPQYPSLSSRQIEALLADLAYWYIRNGISLANVSDVDERLQTNLESFKNLPQDTNGAAVREGFVARSGILREPLEGKIDFPHRTFQEFLAAKKAVKERDFGVLVKNSGDQNWRETIILAVGLASKSEAEALIQNLLKQHDKKPDVSLLLLAVGCLETMVALSDSIKRSVEDRLKELLPPRTLAEARAIAIAGDLAVPNLKKGRMSRMHATACVHALAVIGSDLADLVFESWLSDTREQVWKELLRWVTRDMESERYRAMFRRAGVVLGCRRGPCVIQVLARDGLLCVAPHDGSVRHLRAYFRIVGRGQRRLGTDPWKWPPPV